MKVVCAVAAGWCAAFSAVVSEWMLAPTVVFAFASVDVIVREAVRDAAS